MLTVTARRDKAGIRSISAEGHTGFADHGSDIVCASISSLMQALWLGLEDVIGVKNLDVESDPEIPLMRLAWGSKNSKIDSTQVLARTIFLSIKAIADDYPGYVKVNEVKEDNRT